MPFRLAVLTVLLALGTAAPAEAHAELLRAHPAPESRLARSPGHVALRFGESVVAGRRAVVVSDERGRRVGGATRRHASLLLVSLRHLPRGRYAVYWRVVSDDGHVETGAFGFAVGRGVAPAAPRAASSADPPLAAARAVQFGALGLAAGLLVFWVAAVGRESRPRFAARARPLVAGAAAVGAASAAAGVALEARAAGGSALETRFGWTWVGAAVAWSALGALTVRRRGPGLAAAALLVLLAALPAASGHAAGHHPPAPLVALNLLHVGAMSVWTGGLAGLLVLAPRGDALAETVRRFSPLALAAVAALIATGAGQAVVEAGTPAAALDGSFGTLVAAKLALVGVLIALGAAGRRHRSRPRWRALRRTARLEVALLAAALVLTGLLAGTAPG
ncbi:MAG TPA: copper resistance protein CopC [Solirubrobacteraceae bacterium]|jgi:copper transport protein